LISVKRVAVLSVIGATAKTLMPDAQAMPVVAWGNN